MTRPRAETRVRDARALAAAIRANVDAFYADTIPFPTFHERAGALWGKARGDRTSHDLVLAVLRGDETMLTDYVTDARRFAAQEAR